MEFDESKLLDFYNHSREYIIRADLFYLAIEMLDNNNYRFIPYTEVSGTFVRDWLKENNAQLSIEDEEQIIKANYHTVFIDETVTHDFFIFEHTYIDIPYKDSIVTIIY